MVSTGLNRFKPSKIEFMPANGINALNFSRFKPWFKPGGLNQLPTLTPPPPPNFDRTALLRLHGHAGRLLHKRHQHPGGRERPRGGPVGGDRALTAGAQPDRAGWAAARHPSVLSVPAAAVHRRQSGPALPQLVRRVDSLCSMYLPQLVGNGVWPCPPKRCRVGLSG